VLDFRGGEGAAFGDVVGGAAGGGGGGGLGGAAGDVEDVELSTGGGLDGVFDSGVVGDVVSVHDIIVPVPSTQLEHGRLEAELASPCSCLGRVLGQWQLTGVIVPGAEEMDGLDVGGGAERELELNGGHFCRR
jgi:hypothetical protein